MSLQGLSCRRFSRLINDAEDRILSDPEERFVAAHRKRCDSCRRLEDASAGAFDFLRMAAFDEPEISPAFEQRVIRKVKVVRVQEGLRYWAPAAMGAGIACVALFAALHVASASNTSKRVDLPEGQVRNSAPHRYPSLALDRVPTFTR